MTRSATDKRPGTGAKIGLFLGPAVFVAVLLLPTPADMPVAAKRMAAVAMLMAVWWVAQSLPLAATSLIPIVAFPLLGIMPSAAVAPNYADHNVFLFMGGFMVALAMERWGLHRRIAAKTIMLFGKGMRGMVLGFMTATAFLSMWISNTATTMLMLPIAVATLSKFKEHEKAADLGVALLLGIAFSASVGGIGTLIGTPPNIVLAGAAKRLLPGSPEIGFGQWMLVGVPLVIVFIPVIWLYIVRIAAPLPRDGGNSEAAEKEIESLGPMTRGEKIALGVFAFAALCWVLRKPVIARVFPQATDTTIAITAALLLFIIPVDWKKGEFALDWKQAAKLPWGVLILFGGGFALAAGMQQSGLSDWLGERLATVTGGLPLPAAVLIICVFMAALTELTSNTAITATMMPILAATSVGMGGSPLLFMIPAAMAASCAFMLPVATPPNAIVFGSGLVPLSKMIRIGLLLNVLGAVLITLLMSTLGRAVFG